jgi:predicted GNAT family acetyltransferase
MNDSGRRPAPDSTEVRLRDNSASGAYEAVVGGTVVGSIKYWPHGHRVVFGHTSVNELYRGKGIAAGLVRLALDDVAAKHLTLTNYCPFVAGYIARHPSYQRLIDPHQPGPAEVPADPAHRGTS